MSGLTLDGDPPARLSIITSESGLKRLAARSMHSISEASMRGCMLDHLWVCDRDGRGRSEGSHRTGCFHLSTPRFT